MVRRLEVLSTCNESCGCTTPILFSRIWCFRGLRLYFFWFLFFVIFVQPKSSALSCRVLTPAQLGVSPQPAPARRRAAYIDFAFFEEEKASILSIWTFAKTSTHITPVNKRIVTLTNVKAGDRRLVISLATIHSQRKCTRIYVSTEAKAKKTKPDKQ